MRGLVEASRWEGLAMGKPGLAPVSKSLIQISADGGAVLPPCGLVWGGSALESAASVAGPPYGTLYGRANGELLQEDLHQHAMPPGTAAASAPEPEEGHCQSMPPQETPKLSQASLSQSLVGSLMLGKTEGRRRRGWQRIRQLDGITDSTDMSLNKLGDGGGQGSLACCSPWGCKDSDVT